MHTTDDAPAAGIAYHEGIAGGWNARYGGGGFRRRLAFVADGLLADRLSGERWIDVGCGSGVFTRLLAARGADVLGVDGAAAMIAAAERTAALDEANPPRYRCLAVEDLGPAIGRFDGAICLSVLEYLADPEAGLAALASVVRPGGRLVLSVPNRRALLRLLQQAARRMGALAGRDVARYLAVSRNAYTPATLTAALGRHGFRVDRVESFDPLLPGPAARLVPASLLFAVSERVGAPAPTAAAPR